MKNEEILKKAIEKAIEGGWTEGQNQITNSGGFIDKVVRFYEKDWMLPSLLFDPSFAKAFFGEELTEIGELTPVIGLPIWIYHQHRLLDEIQADRDPVQYLEQFL